MAAYLIARVNVTDPEQYEKYKALTPAAVAAHGGKFIARGGETVTLEGEEEDRRVVVIEFPSFEVAKNFYDSPEYKTARAERENAADGQFVLVDGA
ncbi:MAG: DUF1330 domain-containing protein [Hyphomicrobiales bacterium]